MLTANRAYRNGSNPVPTAFTKDIQNWFYRHEYVNRIPHFIHKFGRQQIVRAKYTNSFCPYSHWRYTQVTLEQAILNYREVDLIISSNTYAKKIPTRIDRDLKYLAKYLNNNPNRSLTLLETKSEKLKLLKLIHQYYDKKQPFVQLAEHMLKNWPSKAYHIMAITDEWGEPIIAEIFEVVNNTAFQVATFNLTSNNRITNRPLIYSIMKTMSNDWAEPAFYNLYSAISLNNLKYKLSLAPSIFYKINLKKSKQWHTK